MHPISELAGQLHRERMARARTMTAGQKLAAGPELFRLAVECMRAGIRLQNPQADEKQIRVLVHERIVRMRRKDEDARNGTT